MRICFSQDRAHVIFLHDDIKEYQALAKFPAFVKVSTYNTCPAIIPVAYSIVSRVQAKFKNKVRVDKDVAEWLEGDFKLLPIPEAFKYHTSPKNFQELSLRYMHTVGGGGILLDPGMGKSKVALDFIWLRQFKRSLIVCPVPLLFVWEDEIAKHRPELTYHVMQSTDWDAEVEAGMLDKHVVIVNYTKLSMLKWRFKTTPFDYIHLDEFLIKDITTDRTKSCLEVAATIPFRSGGSGTLINNSPLDCYPPLKFLQPSLVGSNYTNFKDVYTIQMPIKDDAGRNTDKKRVVNFRGITELKSILESCSIVLTKEEWLKLPPKHFHDTRVQMGAEQKKAYYELARNLTMQIGDRWLTVDNPLVMMAKLYQISNGFLYLYPEDEETEDESYSDLFASDDVPKKKKRNLKDRTIHFFPEQPKITALAKIVREKIPDKKAMIWFNMEAEAIMVEQWLKDNNYSYLIIKGGDKTIGEKVRSFNRDPSIKFLVCQAKSVNYGITVMGSKRKDLEDSGVQLLPGVDPSVHTQIFMSLNFSLEVFLQQQDRVHRLGQEHDCHYYRLFANSPVEMKILDALETKQILRRDMLVDVAHTLLKDVNIEDI